MSNDILISIVVPIYNVGQYLEKCISSIMNQTYKNIEIILVDDGAEDESPYICDNVAKKDERIRVIHKENGGLVSSRKAGVSVATGDYIVAVDGDDWIGDNWIQEYAEAIAKSDADIVYRDGILRDSDGKILDTSMRIKERLYQGDEIIDDLVPLFIDFNPGVVKYVKLNSVAWCYKRSLIQEQIQYVRNEFTICEDMALVTYCIFNANSIFVTKGGKYHYIQRTESMSFMPVDDKKMTTLQNDLLLFLKTLDVSQRVIDIYELLFKVNMLVIDYSKLLKQEQEHLPFFPNVKKGESVVIFGAGRVGRQMYNVIKKYGFCKILAIIDSKSELYKDIDVQEIDYIKKIEFDHVIIASLVSQNIESMRAQLYNLGIPVNKVDFVQPDGKTN